MCIKLSGIRVVGRHRASQQCAAACVVATGRILASGHGGGGGTLRLRPRSRPTEASPATREPAMGGMFPYGQVRVPFYAWDRVCSYSGEQARERGSI
jgi:hypothetical protein